MKKQFFWGKEIEKIVTNIVKFTDGTEKVLSDKQLEYLITDEPIDETQLRDLVLDNVVWDMLKVLEDHNVIKWHIQAIITTLVGSYNQNFNKAVGKAFWTYEEGKHPESYPEQISYLDILRMHKN